jgi:hypothetical protein
VELQEGLRAKHHARGRSCGNDHALTLHPDELKLVEKIPPGGALLTERTQRFHQQLEDFSQLGREGSEALMDDLYRHG